MQLKGFSIPRVASVAASVSRAAAGVHAAAASHTGARPDPVAMPPTHASSSSWRSELVTRTVLQLTAAAAAAGMTPEGISELVAPSAGNPFEEAPSSVHEVGDLDGPTCRRCTLRALSGAAAEALSDILLGLGAQSVSVEEHRRPGAPEQEIFSDGAESSPLWDACDVAAYFSLEDDPREILRAAFAELREAGHLADVEAGSSGRDDDPQFEVEEMVNQQWVDQIKASYVPVRISDTLYIVPEWSSGPDDPSALCVTLQPGVAFGTGEHPTTRLCLLALEAMAPWLRGRTVLDYGCGSGVLALAALQMGAASAVGTDTDGLAVRAARRNAQLNAGSSSRLAVLQCGAGLDDPEPLSQAGFPPELQFDIVVANILRGPLVELQPRLTAYVAPGGRLLLSGILVAQAPEIIAAYSADFCNFNVDQDGLWACIQAERKST